MYIAVSPQLLVPEILSRSTYQQWMKTLQLQTIYIHWGLSQMFADEGLQIKVHHNYTEAKLLLYIVHHVRVSK